MKRLAAVLATACVCGTSLALAQTDTQIEDTHTVRMVLKDGQYRFEPAEVKARAGDRVVFVLESGAPHNVAFDAERVPAAAKAALSRVLPERMSELAGPLLATDGTRYTVVLKDVPPGRYPFYCMPHMALGMTGVLVVAP